MRFRLKAFGLHLLFSALVLSLVLGALYWGWYRWPGWYMTHARPVAAMILGVDLALGPMLTFLIASPRKRLRELARDVTIIVIVQITALGYGAVTLWRGRPLYYAFSVDRLQLVQASDLDAAEIERGRKENPSLAPHWYSTPRFVWAPLPENPEEAARIVNEATLGAGKDVIQMPRLFKTWEQGLPALRAHLKPLDKVVEFSKVERAALASRLTHQGFAVGQSNTLPLTGPFEPVLALIDPQTLRIQRFVKAD
jgi:hypothetical protein